MARRSWRNFDYILLSTLLILSAYGVIMIYSATINTLGVENPVQRQILYIVVGTAVLLATASIDYRLLHILQVPLSILSPIILGFMNVGLVIVWRMQQVRAAELTPSMEMFTSDWPIAAAGAASVVVVYVLDRVWVRKMDLPATRIVSSIAVLAAMGIGVFVFARSAAGLEAPSAAYLLVIGLALAYLLDCLTLRYTDALHNPVYVLVLGMLGLIFLIGQVSGGSQRWLGEGAVQPSELSKILIIIVLAKYLADREDRLDQINTVLTSLGIIGVPMALIYLQPDLGTALTMIAIWMAMIWMGGTRLRHLLVLLIAGLAALPLVWMNLEEYMKQRLLLFINPASDPDSYFNVHQALVSIGSGGWIGKGLTKGTQSQLHFLRVRHTDFIFAVTAEELGFLGAVAMIGLLFLLLWRVLRVAERSRDTFGRLLAVGVGGLVFFQSVINIGMNLGLMPVTGIPLPFVSYGGSSFLTLMLGMGLVESVAMRHKKLEFD